MSKNPDATNSAADPINPYIPKYIVDQPWYSKSSKEETPETYLAHQRKNPLEIVDHSLAQPGQGISDPDRVLNQSKDNSNYDLKRDRWYGSDRAEYDRILLEWTRRGSSNATSRAASKSNVHAVSQEDEDDTDYELELSELGLESQHLKVSARHSSEEQTLRDRHDAPAYIGNIGLNENGKTRVSHGPQAQTILGKTTGIVSDSNQFVPPSGMEARELRQLQKVSWELNEKDVNAQSGGSDVAPPPQTNLLFSLEASPTLAALSARKSMAESRNSIPTLKRKMLLSRYGTGSVKNVNEEDN